MRRELYLSYHLPHHPPTSLTTLPPPLPPSHLPYHPPTSPTTCPPWVVAGYLGRKRHLLLTADCPGNIPGNTAFISHRTESLRESLKHYNVLEPWPLKPCKLTTLANDDVLSILLPLPHVFILSIFLYTRPHPSQRGREWLNRPTPWQPWTVTSWKKSPYLSTESVPQYRAPTSVQSPYLSIEPLPQYRAPTSV